MNCQEEKKSSLCVQSFMSSGGGNKIMRSCISIQLRKQQGHFWEHKRTFWRFSFQSSVTFQKLAISQSGCVLKVHAWTQSDDLIRICKKRKRFNSVRTNGQHREEFQMQTVWELNLKHRGAVQAATRTHSYAWVTLTSNRPSLEHSRHSNVHQWETEGDYLLKMWHSLSKAVCHRLSRTTLSMLLLYHSHVSPASVIE